VLFLFGQNVADQQRCVILSMQPVSIVWIKVYVQQRVRPARKHAHVAATTALHHDHMVMMQGTLARGHHEMLQQALCLGEATGTGFNAGDKISTGAAEDVDAALESVVATPFRDTFSPHLRANCTGTRATPSCQLPTKSIPAKHPSRTFPAVPSPRPLLLPHHHSHKRVPPPHPPRHHPHHSHK
jgi:hypothetical protein